MKELIPDLYCPFPSQINKHVDVLEDYTLEWVTRFNLLRDESAYKRFRKSKFYLLAAGAYPYSPMEEIKIASDWLSWVFIWDDQCDLSQLSKQPEVLKAFHDRFLEILNGSALTVEDIPLAYALSDLRQRTLQRGSIKWYRHFLCSFEEWFNGCVEETIVRAQGTVPDLTTYTKVRQSSIGVDTFLALTEFCDRLIIPDNIRNHGIVNKMKFMTGHIIACCNDIFSASREMKNADVNNSVIILHHQLHISLEEAINCVVKIHNQAIKTMLDLEKSLPNFGEKGDTEVMKYISGMYAWIRSNQDWYSQTSRYENLERLELNLIDKYKVV